ncbi:MAG: phosphoribosylamine--glycine ligase [Gemmatimonadota bacterium]
MLLVGNGGREHALAWKLAREASGAELLFTGGNAGLEELAEPAPLSPLDVPGLLDLARRRAVDLTVIGPEAPLAAGLADAFAEAGLRVFGPRRAAAEIESRKAFAKDFLRRHAIPTAEYRSFTGVADAEAFLRAGEGPIVVKASGLAAGKGAVLCEDRAEAVRVAGEMLREGAFGEAGREIVVEKRLEGRELSVIALTDGETIRPLLPARDHKRALEGDRGPNTGGMGAVAPVPDVGEEVLEEIAAQVLAPTVRGLANEGRSFRGALYAGLMLTEGGPQVIEFNARFGDPETQVLLPLLESPLLELLLACAEPRRGSVSLAELEPTWRAGAACCVVAASAGYPGAYERGHRIDLGTDRPEAVVFHAGTERHAGELMTAGGRVLAVTGLGADAEAARRAAYARLEAVRFPGITYREDIGLARRGPGDA